MVILNGGWAGLSQGEDSEAPRRLFYVSMTRAKRTLAVVPSGAHVFVTADSEAELLRKIPPPRASDLPEPDQYLLPDMKTVDLSFAGRLPAGSQSLQAIAEAEVGDRITLDLRDGKWQLLDTRGRVLGRMAGKWQPPPGRLVNASVGAVVLWRKADNEEAWQDMLKRDQWETVLPDLIFRQGDRQAPRASFSP